jgi:hypothetical protein
VNFKHLLVDKILGLHLHSHYFSCLFLINFILPPFLYFEATSQFTIIRFQAHLFITLINYIYTPQHIFKIFFEFAVYKARLLVSAYEQRLVEIVKNMRQRIFVFNDFAHLVQVLSLHIFSINNSENAHIANQTVNQNILDLIQHFLPTAQVTKEAHHNAEFPTHDA